MKILAVDLGSDYGAAYNESPDGRVEWVGDCLATKRELAKQRADRGDRRNDLRVQRFFQRMQLLKMQLEPNLVVFEDVQFVKSRDQAHLWSSYRAALWIVFPPDKFRVDCVATNKLKQFATSNGGADKLMMAHALARANPERFQMRGENLIDTTADSVELTDDAVDAIWLWLWAKHTYARKNA